MSALKPCTIQSVTTTDCITSEGMQYLNARLHAMRGTTLPAWFSNAWINSQNDPTLMIDTPIGPKPVKYAGKLPKRVNQYLHKHNTEPLDQDALSVLANSLASYRTLPVTLHYDITDRFDWNDGDFGDRGSCFWGDRASALDALESAGGMALRFYDASDYGQARCWLWKTDDTYILFNAYVGYGDSPLRNTGNHLRAMANIALTILGSEYTTKRISLSNHGTPMGQMWINGGKGIAIAKTHAFSSYDLEIDCEDEDGTYCAWCDDRIYDIDYYYVDGVGSLCEYCYSENYTRCDSCSEDTPSEDAHFVEDGEIVLCDDCYRDEYTPCSICETVVHHNDVIDTSDGYQCKACAQGKIIQCDRCDETYNVADTTPITCTRRAYYAECDGALTLLSCAHCGRAHAWGECIMGADGLAYCPACRSHAPAECLACHVQDVAPTVYTTTHLDTFCLACAPPLPTLEHYIGATT